MHFYVTKHCTDNFVLTDNRSGVCCGRNATDCEISAQTCATTLVRNAKELLRLPLSSSQWIVAASASFQTNKTRISCCDF